MNNTMSDMGDLKFTTAGEFMMTTEPFKVYKAHKMADWIENHVTEWASILVTEHFDCDVEELTREQIQEVADQYDELYDYDPTIALGFRNVINSWENENEEYLDI